ncbi:MAG: indole-3-glycerol phosphate synthase TrpC, partial [Lachnospiraceae bacterium]|nr:indole-3-glycerol phosphate synthase TrpC [Lachnospiraceae bacterium]
MTILDEIAAKTRVRISEKKEICPPAELIKRVENIMSAQKDGEASKISGDHRGYAFYSALSKPGISYICEVKKASPSKGLIAEDFPYLDIAKEYETAGASAISCLTEPYWFLGRDEYLSDITENVAIPVLRKDFTVDEYMIYEAKALGAAAILLICAILTDAELKEYSRKAYGLGLDCLVEAHDEEEIRRAKAAGANIIGVNNRNLHDFSVDQGNALRLRKLVGDDALFVSESGIQTGEDIQMLRDARVDAVLIGETLMRASDKGAKLMELNGGA